VSSRRIRAVLRSEYGVLPPLETHWHLNQSQIDHVRSRFAGAMPSAAGAVVAFSETVATRSVSEVSETSLGQSSVPDLLEAYASILTELKARKVVRTSNAPLGDYAEYLAQKVYGGSLAPNSSKSYDVTAEDGRLIQVKARTLGEGTSTSAVFSVFRSFDFDVATVLVFDSATYDLLWAREVSPAEVENSARWSSHVNGRLLRMSVAKTLGEDVTHKFLDKLNALELEFLS
jgi:hypothetical protein